MNIVVTKNNVDYSSSFLQVTTLSEVCGVVGVIDVLVYHDSDEDSETKITSLGELKSRVNKFIYIRNEEDTDIAIKMMILGLGGKYFYDEFFLENVYELRNLIDSLEEVTALATLGGVNVLGDFFNRYLEKGSSDFNGNYLMLVKDAVNELMTEYNQKNLEILAMSKTATEVFSRTSSLLSHMKQERESMQDIVKKMSEKAKESSSVMRRQPGSSILFFPGINYTKERSIIRIKEIGDFRYLVSFILGLRSYLDTIKNIRTKVIIIEPIGSILEDRYSDFSWVTSSSIKSSSNYYNSIVFTNHPTKEVITKLLDDSDYDTFIVVDRLLTDKSHILNCRGGSVKYAVSSSGYLDKMGLKVRECFSSVEHIQGVLFNVPVISEYPLDRGARVRTYLSNMSINYDRLLQDAKLRR